MLEYQPPYFRDFLIDIDANPSDGHSASYQLPEGIVPVSVSIPSALQGSVRLTLVVADLDASDATGFELIYGEDNALDHIVLGTSRTLDVPTTVRRGCLGRGYIRVLAMNGTNVAREPDADITFRVYFADARMGLS